MPVSLIITVYKDYEALERVLDSVYNQTLIPAQVIIAHDTIDPLIKATLLKFQDKLKVLHLDQEDTGFNKNRILNKAIIQSQYDRLVFIDGDCILHPKFIESHKQYINEGFFTAARRLDLDAKSSNRLRKSGIHSLGIFRMLVNGTQRIEEGFYFPFHPLQKNKIPRLIGCNMGWHKNDLYALNGFDMDYGLPGFGEDTDIEFRAKLKGMRPINLRWKAIQYHLFHARPDRENEVSVSREMFEKKKEIGYFYCENGISTLIDKFPHE